MLREQNTQEKNDFIPISTPRGRVLTPEEKFKKEVIKHEQQAVKEFKPFASQVLNIEFKDNIKEQADKSKKLHGHVKREEIVQPEVDWKRYSDLKNFDLIEEGEQFDDALSKRHNLSIYIKFKKYRFKQYSYEYTIMEDPNKSIQRARNDQLPVKVEIKK